MDLGYLTFDGNHSGFIGDGIICFCLWFCLRLFCCCCVSGGAVPQEWRYNFSMNFSVDHHWPLERNFTEDYTVRGLLSISFCLYLSLFLSLSHSPSLSLEWWRAVPNCPLLPTNIRLFYPQPSTGQSKKHLSHDLGVLVTWLQCVGHMTSLSLSLQNQVIKRYGDEAESSAGYYADYQRNYITSPLSSDQFRTNINLLKEATCESDTSLFEQVNS